METVIWTLAMHIGPYNPSNLFLARDWSKRVTWDVKSWFGIFNDFITKLQSFKYFETPCFREISFELKLTFHRSRNLAFPCDILVWEVCRVQRWWQWGKENHLEFKQRNSCGIKLKIWVRISLIPGSILLHWHSPSIGESDAVIGPP